jgi:[acyl-carrier-protein] S-malonyltransferase
MSKAAFIFPGQGSQEVGMGQDLFREDPWFRSLIELGCDIVHEDLEKICLRGPETELMKAKVLQTLLVAVCLGYLRKLVEKGIKPDIVLGHSLGEITSLAASGVVSAEDALRIAAKRGELMDKVASSCNGGMLAVLFVSLENVKILLGRIGDPNRLVLANDNAPDQVVISGDIQLIEEFQNIITKERLGKFKRVPVIGPWHSPYMEQAREIFESWVEQVPFNEPSIPIIMNALARTEQNPMIIKRLVTYQLTSPVFWRESMAFLKTHGVDRIFEIGPGRVLSGLARVNGFRKETTIYNINNLNGVNIASSELIVLSN